MRKMNGEEFDELVSFFDSMARTEWLSGVHDTLKEKQVPGREKRARCGLRNGKTAAPGSR